MLSRGYRSVSGWWSDACINVSSASPFWKFLPAVNKIFFSGMSMIPVNGRGTRFWMDKWCGSSIPGVLFPDLFVGARNNLIKRNWQGPNICVLCCKDTETIDHLFMTYPYLQEVWEFDRSALGFSFPKVPTSMDIMWSS